MTAMTIEPQDLDVSVLSDLLEITDPDLLALELPEETGEELAARQQAAADITATLLEATITDHPDGIAAGVEHVASLARLYVDRLTEEAEAKVTRWLSEIREAAL